MPYTPIPEDDLCVPQKSMAQVLGGDLGKTKELLRQLPQAKVFGLLLSADSKSALAEVVRTRWSELHHLSGDEFVVVAFDAPKEWTPMVEEYWKNHLGDSFGAVWDDWQQGRGVGAGAAFEWRDLFEPPIAAKDLPCLVLFTDLESKQAVIRPIPDWDADSIYRFLMAQFDSVRSCCAQPPEERLACLKASVGSTGGKLNSYKEHFTEEAWQYLKEHPTTVAMTTVKLLVALATANVIPLTGTALTTLKVVKDLFGKS